MLEDLTECRERKAIPNVALQIHLSNYIQALKTGATANRNAFLRVGRRRIHHLVPAQTPRIEFSRVQLLFVQVIPLSGVRVAEFESLFEQEIRNWRRELFWDYRPTIGLIRRQIQSRCLPGHAIVSSRGVLAGYSYYLIDRMIGTIGNLYVAPEWSTLENYDQLLRETLFSLRSWGNVQRVECQLVPFNCDLTSLFRQHGFSIVKRYFLSLPVADLNLQPAVKRAPDGFSTQPWKEHFHDAVAEIIHDSFQDSPDGQLCHDYQTPSGCSRFLQNLVRGPGCGVFTPESSYLALDQQKQVCAVIITSRIGPGIGMIPQLSVRRRDQRKGLGSWLLQTYFQVAQKEGLHRIILSVSESNRVAFRLYDRVGFRPTQAFHAYLWEA